MIKINSGIWEIKWFKKKASTAFTKKEFVTVASGFVLPADASAATLMGVNQDNEVAVGSTTTDYIPVMVPKSKGCTVRATANGTCAEGGEYDLVDSETVDQASSTTDVVTCAKAVSATEAIFFINKPQAV